MKVSVEDWGTTVTVENAGKGVHIKEFISAFCGALEALGFSENTIKQYISEEGNVNGN